MAFSDLTQAGKYEILRRVGAGGFGVVYLGRDPLLQRLVAIKACTAPGDELKQRFLREAEIAGSLPEHPNVTLVYDFGYQDEVPYLVTELLSGDDLSSLLERGEPIALERRLAWLVQIARGLAFAHAHGVVHRDVKPGNIRVTDDGTVKLMDFGIAKLDRLVTQLTRTGSTLGTPAYLSPEQLRGEPVDRRADIYSFGVVAHEVLVYRRPFANEGGNLSAMLYAILEHAPPRLEEHWPQAPAELERLVARCLAKRADERYASFDEVLCELAPFAATVAGSALGRDLGPAPPPARSQRETSPWETAAAASGEEALRSIHDARLEVERLLESGELETAVRSLDAARRTFGDLLPFRALEERIDRLRGTTANRFAQPTTSDAAAVALEAQLLFDEAEWLLARDRVLDAQSVLRELRQLAPRWPGTLALERQVERALATSGSTGASDTLTPATEVTPRPRIATAETAGSTASAGSAGADAPTVLTPRLARQSSEPVTPRRAASGRSGRWTAIAVALVVLAGAAFGAWSLLWRPTAPPQHGHLVLDPRPWARLVSLRGPDGEVALENLGDGFTPLVLELPSGSYRIELAHPERELDLVLEATVRGGESTRLVPTVVELEPDRYFSEAGW